MSNRFLGGSFRMEHGCEFRVWAPFAKKVEVRISSPMNRLIEMQRQERGYHYTFTTGVGPGARYRFRLDDERERPDPASHFQPAGIHEASEVMDPAFDWHDDHWFGLPLRDFASEPTSIRLDLPKGQWRKKLDSSHVCWNGPGSEIPM